MMKEIQRKKKVLIDLTNYGSLTAGFGQIAANYATAFSSMPVDDLHFVYLLRQKYMQEFGPNVTSVPVRRINKFFPFTLPKVDVWHAVNQQRKMLRIAGGTKFIFTIHDFNFLTEKKPWKAKMYLRRMQNKVKGSGRDYDLSLCGRCHSAACRFEREGDPGHLQWSGENRYIRRNKAVVCYRASFLFYNWTNP